MRLIKSLKTKCLSSFFFLAYLYTNRNKKKQAKKHTHEQNESNKENESNDQIFKNLCHEVNESSNEIHNFVSLLVSNDQERKEKK